MKDFLARVKVRWHIVALAFVAALPELLNWLGVADLRPLLSHFLAAEYVELVVGCLPFVLAFVKPLIHMEDHK